MTFSLYPWRFCFVAREPIHFPEGKASNVLRGAFGSLFRNVDGRAYSRIFEPTASDGPSGLGDSPRPFVFRAMHLDGCMVSEGERFHFDLNVFETRDPTLRYFVATFTEAARVGLGPGRGSAELESVWQCGIDGGPQIQVHGDGTLQNADSPLVLPLGPEEHHVRRLRVDFVTPTELKAGHVVAAKPEFGVLFARARDRVSTLRSLYGDGPLDLDFRATGERTAAVRMTRCELRQVDIERRSSRTGQVHPLGGFVGEAEYEGELAEFVPILRAAQWTGVGRQTVWGKGAIRLRREAA